MNTIFEKFIAEVNQKFEFLEKEFGFIKIEGKIYNCGYYPDSELVVKYIGQSIGIEVYWYFAGANIGVAFVELVNGELPVKRMFFGDSKDAPKAFTIYSLARFLNLWDDNIFLLKDVDNTTIPKIKVRERIIRDNITGVIEGLSIAVKKYAIPTVIEDTSIFEKVINYQNEYLKRHYS